ncbi:MAG TPA: alpha/beta family hydrolase [Patescibacteria group bacterium]
MKTMILPGFSIKNKDWAYETKKALEPEIPAEVVEWDHWTTNNTSFADWGEWMKVEVSRVAKKMEGEKLNILAKSIGTAVAMNILKTNPNTVNKLVLCGIPLRDLGEEEKKSYQILKTFPDNNFICIQNEQDNHGSFEEIREFLHSINPNLKVISKPADTHDYPYSEEFTNALKG